MQNLKYAELATPVAVGAARDGPVARRRWGRQNEYDADHMHTESTRFTMEQDQRLRRYCREARVTRYTLISYLLRTWMAAWEAYKGERDVDSSDTTSGGR